MSTFLQFELLILRNKTSIFEDFELASFDCICLCFSEKAVC